MPDESHFPLPVALEEITADWMTTALRIRHPGITVTRVEIADMVHGTTTKIRLRVELDAAGKNAGLPEIMILKGGFEPHSRSIGQDQMF